MAKFVDWANSLLMRFEEQVSTSFFNTILKFSSLFPIFQDVAQEKSIISLQVIFLLFVILSHA
jgi:hypothetical protein